MCAQNSVVKSLANSSDRGASVYQKFNWLLKNGTPD